MKHEIFVVAYFVIMAAVIIGLDVAFLRDHFWWRLAVNIGVVPTFGAV